MLLNHVCEKAGSLKGKRVLELGSGLGHLAVGLCRRVSSAGDGKPLAQVLYRRHQRGVAKGSQRHHVSVHSEGATSQDSDKAGIKMRKQLSMHKGSLEFASLDPWTA